MQRSDVMKKTDLILLETTRRLQEENSMIPSLGDFLLMDPRQTTAEALGCAWIVKKKRTATGILASWANEEARSSWREAWGLPPEEVMDSDKSLPWRADEQNLPNRVVPARWTISPGVGQFPGDGLFNRETKVNLSKGSGRVHNSNKVFVSPYERVTQKFSKRTSQNYESNVLSQRGKMKWVNNKNKPYFEKLRCL